MSTAVLQMGPRLSWEILASAGAHLMVFAVLMVARCGDGKVQPLLKPEEVIMVEMSAPLKQQSAMPQKAERAPIPTAGSPEVAPPAIPPPKQSELAIQTPDAPKVKGDPKAEKLREEMLAEMRRQQLLQDLNAPVGRENRAATSPDGVDDPSLAGSGSGKPTNAELAKWAKAARELINPNWHPILSVCQAAPNLTVKVRVVVDGQGNRKEDPRVSTPSGNSSFDGSCLRAVEATLKLPPTPSTHPDGWDADLVFSCKEAL